MKKIVLTSALLAISGAVLAGPCDITITANDAMKYSLNSITVPKTCEKFTVNLQHIGKQPKKSMGHNWVLTETKNVAGVAADGLKAGLASNYLKKGDKRIIAATNLIGGGEKTSVTFPVAQLSADKNYTFMCVFPGHTGLMKGKLILK